MNQPISQRHENRIISLLSDERFLKFLGQFIFITVLAIAVVVIFNTVITALASKNLAPNFSFLQNKAGFNIGGAEGYYSPDDTYGRAFQVGLENTIRVVVAGLILTTLLGVLVGITLLSRNFLIRTISKIYVEILRNTPLLVQLFAWYLIGVLALPPIRNAIEIPSNNPLIAMSAKGVYLAEVWPTPRFSTFLVFMLIGLGIAVIQWIYFGRVKEATGQPAPRLWYAVGAVLIAIVIGWIAASSAPAPTTITLERDGEQVETTLQEAQEQDLFTRDERIQYSSTPLTIIHPERQGLRYANGAQYTSEYIALLLGLVVYTSAFIAEIVRAGILAVDKGQLEAARALGLSYSETMSMIILPQALRVIIPPLGNQYLNLAKNSSLAIAISYADVFQVSTTIMNQSVQPVSVYTLIMASYLTISLLISIIMNVVNSRFQLVTRK